MFPRLRSFLARGADTPEPTVSAADYRELSLAYARAWDRVAALEDALTHAEHARVVAEGELDRLTRLRVARQDRRREKNRAPIAAVKGALDQEHAAKGRELVEL